MAKYTEVTTTGPIEWAKLFPENMDKHGYKGAYVECEGAYTVNQILSKEEYLKLRAAGTSKRYKEKRFDETEERVVNFVRKHKVTNKKGEVIPQAGGAPVVHNSDGNVWDFEKDGKIGNGSLAEVTNLISTFELASGEIGSRTVLTKVKILELVPYGSDLADQEVGF